MADSSDDTGLLRERGGFHVLGPITTRILKDIEEGGDLWDAVDLEADAERSEGLGAHLIAPQIPRQRLGGSSGAGGKDRISQPEVPNQPGSDHRAATAE